MRSELSLSVSLGASVGRLEGTVGVQEVVQMADDSLFSAKDAGRNRVETRLAGPPGD